MLHIRKAEMDDLEDIAQIHFEAWTVAYKSVFSPGELDWGCLEARREKWRAQLEREEHGHFAAVEGGTTVGFFSLVSPEKDDLPIHGEGEGNRTLELQSIYFSPQHWHRGFGTQCMSYIFSKARQEGRKKLAVWFLKENQTMAAFLRKLGFAPDGGEKIVGDSIDLEEIRYCLAL